MILSLSGRRVEVALAHNQKGCVTRADDPSPSLRRASSGVGYYSITRPVGCGTDALKAVVLPGFPFIYQDARVPRTRCGAGIVSTPRLTAVAHSCKEWTGLVNCPVAAVDRLAAVFSCEHWPRIDESLRGQLRCSTTPYHRALVVPLDTRRSGWQSDMATAKR